MTATKRLPYSLKLSRGWEAFLDEKYNGDVRGKNRHVRIEWVDGQVTYNILTQGQIIEIEGGIHPSNPEIMADSHEQMLEQIDKIELISTEQYEASFYFKNLRAENDISPEQELNDITFSHITQKMNQILSRLDLIEIKISEIVARKDSV